MNRIVKGPDGKPGYEIQQVFPGAEIVPPVDPACKM
jgi:branched-chain amino acid transport system substrate-binding protein